MTNNRSRLMIVLSMAMFGTLAPFVRNIRCIRGTSFVQSGSCVSNNSCIYDCNKAEIADKQYKKRVADAHSFWCGNGGKLDTSL